MKAIRNQLFLPLNFEVLIDENEPVRKLTEICDTLDYFDAIRYDFYAICVKKPHDLNSK